MRDVRTGSSSLNFMSMNSMYKSIFTLFLIELYFMIKDIHILCVGGGGGVGGKGGGGGLERAKRIQKMII